jgi:hypothetical protein
MERVKGFEPSASSLARKRSSQLSYTRITGTTQVPCHLVKVNGPAPFSSLALRNITVVRIQLFYVVYHGS